jgi:hypothetical protein
MEYAPLSISSIAFSNASFVHILLLVFGGIQFSCGADLLFSGSGARGRLSLLVAWFVTYKSNMLLYLLQGTIKFMIVYLFLVLASNKFVECVLAPLRLCFFLPWKQPKNLKSVVNLEILL